MEEKYREVKTVKLPKLEITKFSEEFSDWLPLSTTFEAEINSANLPAVSKFGYLKELFSEIINALIQNIMGLLGIT